MAEDVFAFIAGVAGLDKLDTLERNIHAKGACTPGIEQALQAKYAEFGHVMVEQKTGLDLADLPPKVASSTRSTAMSRCKNATVRMPNIPSASCAIMA